MGLREGVSHVSCSISGSGTMSRPPGSQPVKSD